MALSTDYLKLSHMSCAADELALSFFNAALGSLTQNDYIFTYDVPMNGQRIGADVTLRWQTIEGARDMNCCQANGSRGLSQVVEWAAFSDETGLYLNFYGPCAIAAHPSDRGDRLSPGRRGDYHPGIGRTRNVPAAYPHPLLVGGDGAFGQRRGADRGAFRPVLYHGTRLEKRGRPVPFIGYVAALLDGRRGSQRPYLRVSWAAIAGAGYGGFRYGCRRLRF